MNDGGMKVPEGIDAISGAVPEEIPDHLFTEDEAVTNAKKGRPAPPPPSARMIRVAKPASIPKMPAVKPPLPPSAPKLPAARPVSIPDMPPEPTPAIPSSFPSVGKQLVVELAPPPPPPAPSSLDALVTAIEPEPISTRGPTSTPEPVVRNATPIDLEPLPAGVPAPIASRARFVMLTSLVAAGVVAIGGSFLWSARAGIQTAVASGGARTAGGVSPPVAAAPPSPPPTPVTATPAPEAPAPEAAAAPAPSIDVPAGMGRVKTQGSTAGRRIFVDQRTVGQTPEAVVVKCGTHRVRIGSAGKTVTVDVPCGGEIEVRDR